jgi:hypothetical protein
MLDVHPPHEATHTWKDFFIHVATICVGLLIAVGLEQTVEFFHHRHQVSEAREALRAERALNLHRFQLENEILHTNSALLQTDAEIYDFLRAHPHAARASWPGEINLYGALVTYNNSAWKTAQQSGVLTYMPQSEVKRLDELYQRLDQINGVQLEIRVADFDARAIYLAGNPADLESDDWTKAKVALDRLRIKYALVAQLQRNVSTRFPDFPMTATPEDVRNFMHEPDVPTQRALWRNQMDRLAAIDEEFEPK